MLETDDCENPVIIFNVLALHVNYHVNILVIE
jgi:hypothetical protein